MNQISENPTVSPLSNEAGYDSIEEPLRATVRTTIEAMFEEELAELLGRIRYGRGSGQRVARSPRSRRSPRAKANAR